MPEPSSIDTQEGIDGTRVHRIRGALADILDQGSTDWQARGVQYGLVALVVVSVGASVLESVPSYARDFASLFLVIEAAAGLAFTLEYVARIWSAPEDALYAELSSWRSRLRWATRPQSIIDLVSIAPVYVALVTTIDLKSLLILRLLRFFKLARHSPGIASLADAIYAERRALTACGVILVGIVLLAASAMHFAEQDAQPDKLGTIPDAMYWAFVTLATVGYGDVVPVTPLGKVIAAATAVVGIIMLALPVGILASAFADEIRRRDFVVTWTMVARVPLFAGLGASDLAGIMRFLKARSCEAGEAVVRRGEPARSMYFVTSGNVQVELDTPVPLGPGDFFGEMALLHGTERTATVSASSRVRLLELGADDLNYLMDQTPAMGDQIRRIAEERRHDHTPPTPHQVAEEE